MKREKFHLPTVIQAYLLFVQEKAGETNEEELNLKKERTLLIRAQRKKTELELQVMRGELHRSEDIERVMNDMLGAFRARCLSIPSKTSPQVIGQDDLAVVQDIIKKEVYEALSELANYDPAVFYARSKDKIVLDKEEESFD